MSKAIISVTVEYEIIEEARRKGINISEAAEMGIAQATGQSRKMAGETKDAIDRVRESLSQNTILRFIATIEKDKAFIRGWKRILLQETGYKLTENETLELYRRLKA